MTTPFGNRPGCTIALQFGFWTWVISWSLVLGHWSLPQSLALSLFHGFDEGEAGRDIEREFSGDRGVGLDVAEFVAHARAIDEDEFGAGEGEGWVKEDINLGHQFAGAGGFGLEFEENGRVGFGRAQNFELIFEIGAGTGEAGLEQGEGVLPFVAAGIFEIIFLGALKVGIEDEHGVGVANGDGLVFAEFPTEILRGGEPDLAGGDERLGKGFEVASLDEFGGPGLDVGLVGEPAGDDAGGVGGLG